MRLMMVLMLGALTGCARFTDAQIQLVDEARKGMELCRSAQKERSALVEQYQQAQRARLDEAFAADIRAQAQLSAEWVLEHQKAYSAAVAVFDRQRAASAEADAAALRNFDAIDEALRRLLALQNVQMRLSIDGLIAPGK